MALVISTTGLLLAVLYFRSEVKEMGNCLCFFSHRSYVIKWWFAKQQMRTPEAKADNVMCSTKTNVSWSYVKSSRDATGTTIWFTVFTWYHCQDTLNYSFIETMQMFYCFHWDPDGRSPICCRCHGDSSSKETIAIKTIFRGEFGN